MARLSENYAKGLDWRALVQLPGNMRLKQPLWLALWLVILTKKPGDQSHCQGAFLSIAGLSMHGSIKGAEEKLVLQVGPALLVENFNLQGIYRV